MPQREWVDRNNIALFVNVNRFCVLNRFAEQVTTGPQSGCEAALTKAINRLLYLCMVEGEHTDPDESDARHIVQVSFANVF
jgi:hypothetical protein